MTQPMSTTHAVPETSIDLTDARFARALGEEMDVERTASLTYEVRHDGETYAIDLQSASCTCPDAQYRSFGCKHAIKCALHALFTDGAQSRFVAQVARFACEQGCPSDANGCDGPCGVGTYPCPECVSGVGVGDWTVWTHLVRDTGGEH